MTPTYVRGSTTDHVATRDLDVGMRVLTADRSSRHTEYGFTPATTKLGAKLRTVTHRRRLPADTWIITFTDGSAIERPGRIRWIRVLTEPAHQED